MLKLDWNLLFTVINLLILVGAMWYFLFKPVRKILEARQAEADRENALAKAKTAEAEAVKARYEKCLSDTEEERRQIIAKARKQADEEYKKIVNNARSTAKRIEADATEDAARSKARIVADAEQEIADMIAIATEKNVGERRGAGYEDALYEQFLNEVAKDEAVSEPEKAEGENE